MTPEEEKKVKKQLKQIKRSLLAVMFTQLAIVVLILICSTPR